MRKAARLKLPNSYPYSISEAQKLGIIVGKNKYQTNVIKPIFPFGEGLDHGLPQRNDQHNTFSQNIKHLR